MTRTLIFCAGRNQRYAEIALAHGFAYGCRSDYRPLFPVTFADLDWKRPDLERHAAFVAEHRPRLAVAPDVLTLGALDRTLAYAERLAQHAERVIIVPKADGVVTALPRENWLVLGYSVPSAYGGADGQMLMDWRGWPVHLLGGTPHAQLRLARYLEVISADGNAHMKCAGWGGYWEGGRWVTKQYAKIGVGPGPDLPYRAFDRSCRNIAAAWHTLALQE